MKKRMKEDNEKLSDTIIGNMDTDEVIEKIMETIRAELDWCHNSDYLTVLRGVVSRCKDEITRLGFDEETGLKE